MLYLAILSIFATQDGSPQSETGIVVTGQSIASTRRLLEECLTRSCSVEEDGRAALAHAENQFVSGQYRDALKTIGSALGRNRRHARDFPVVVSDLSRARARVAAHLGLESLERSDWINTLSALTSGLPDNDPKVIGALVELGDFNARSGDVRGARERYTQALRIATNTKLEDFEGLALLRLANLYLAASSRDQSYRSQADRSLADIATSTKPGHLPYAKAARILIALDASRSGNDSEIDKLIEEIRSLGGTARPVLIHAPAIDLSSLTSQNFSRRTRSTAISNFDDQWIDVSFRVTSSGKVTDIEILRKGENTSDTWIGPVRDAIAARRYAPMNYDDLDPGIFRVERFTLTSRWSTGSGSRIRARDGQPRIETLDLSIDRPSDSES